MTLKDIIMQTSFDKVWPETRKVFHFFERSCQKEIDTLHRLFDVLKNIEPNPTQSGWENCPLPKGSKMILRVVHGDVSGFVDKASLNVMKNGLFVKCVRLTSVVIPESVSIVESRVFEDLYGLESIKGAFSCCPSLKTVVIKGADTKIMPDAFDLDALQSIFVPAGSEMWYKSMLPEELHDKVKTSLLSN